MTDVVSPERPLRPLEAMAWYLDHTVPSHVVMVGTFSGPMAGVPWPDVLAALQRRHPLLRAAVRTDPLRFVDTDAAIPLTLVATDDPDDWRTQAATEIHVPLQTFAGPLARVVVVHALTRATVILTIHHGIGDGISMMHVFGDILELLAGSVEGTGLARSGSRASAETQAAPQPRACGLDARSPRPPVFRTEPPQIQTRRLEPQHLASLLARAHQEKTGVAALIASAIARASQDGPRPHMRIAVPIDVRPLTGAGTALQIEVAFTILAVARDGAAPFWPQARALKQALTAQASPEALAPGGALLEQAASTGFDDASAADFMGGAMACDLLLSTIGVVPFPAKRDAFALEALLGPIVLLGGPQDQSIGAVTIRGALHLMHVGYQAPPNLLERVVDVLVTATSA